MTGGGSVSWCQLGDLWRPTVYVWIMASYLFTCEIMANYFCSLSHLWRCASWIFDCREPQSQLLWNPPLHSHWGHSSLGCDWPVTEHGEDTTTGPFWETWASLNSEFTERLSICFSKILSALQSKHSTFFSPLPRSHRLDLHFGLISQPPLTAIPFSHHRCLPPKIAW